MVDNDINNYDVKLVDDSGYVDSRSRKWLLTINNPVNFGYYHDVIINLVKSFKSVVYFCLCDEIGGKGTYHTHIFLAASSAIRFSTLKNKFPEAHIDYCNGSSQQNRDYLLKCGDKHKDKEHTSVEGTFEEFGEIPIERQGKRNDIDDLYDMISSGLSNSEILKIYPSHMLHLDKIDAARLVVLRDKFGNVNRNVDVTYISGSPGVGKTSYVLNKLVSDMRDVYRVSNYQYPFDGYNGQDILCLDEFTGRMNVELLNNVLDIYPFELPCRYNNKQACYTKVYIISNFDLKNIYLSIKNENKSLYESFLRRIHHVIKFTSRGCFISFERKDYIPLSSDIPDFVQSTIDFNEL